ncbi:hypothetical protein J3F84DRAFT_361020 [Trichoderma pleuroticola]
MCSSLLMPVNSIGCVCRLACISVSFLETCLRMIFFLLIVLDFLIFGLYLVASCTSLYISQFLPSPSTLHIPIKKNSFSRVMILTASDSSSYTIIQRMLYTF